MSGIVYAGAVAPEALVVAISNAAAPAPQFDLSTVSAASFTVLLPNGSTTTWSATTAYSAGASPPSSGVLTVTHAYASNDVTTLGVYVAVAQLTLPGGTIRSVPVSFQVVNQFSIS